ncbi:RloB family protein [Agathobaculum sp. Marseille-P7918]|uniref:RloB family protein n=1 Tax=Agathobaculum sp. Marseille-P7918 TaxID=2479843 RepID=UPI000F631C53|nr:RloB family protein [Agathobaculum sp. Marseille-P7918]
MSRTFFEKRKSGIPRERAHNFRSSAPDSFLILTEGTKTEPGYFNGIKQYIEQKFKQGQIEIRPAICCEGAGCSTGRLLEEAEKYVSRGNKVYQHVWLVFDRDNFVDFDDAICRAEAKGYRIAWSNVCFELWLCLHHNYYDAGALAHEWSSRVNAITGLDHAHKTDEAIKLFPMLSANGGLQKAVKNARKLDKQYDESLLPSQRNPCTKVYELILELKPYLEELLPDE